MFEVIRFLQADSSHTKAAASKNNPVVCNLASF